MSLNQQVSAAASMLSVLVVLISLFTGEQSRRLDFERGRQGGAEPRVAKSVTRISVGLAVVSGASLLAATPLAVEVARTCCSGGWQVPWALFDLLCLLLIPLCVWQIVLAKTAHSLSGKQR